VIRAARPIVFERVERNRVTVATEKSAVEGRPPLGRREPQGIRARSRALW
jgi:hypothetical protein